MEYSTLTLKGGGDLGMEHLGIMLQKVAVHARERFGIACDANNGQHSTFAVTKFGTRHLTNANPVQRKAYGH